MVLTHRRLLGFLALTAATATLLIVHSALAGTTVANVRPATFARGVQSTIPSVSLNAASCSSPGDCTAVGSFNDSVGYQEAFAQTQTDGKWTKGTPVRFAVHAQSATPDASFSSVSCSSPGDCTAAGYFQDVDTDLEAFTDTEINGRWAIAKPVRYPSGVHGSVPDDQLASVSCTSPGDCTAAGQFDAAAGGYGAFTETQTDGKWTNAEPATYAADSHSTSPYDQFKSVSCSSPDDCTTVGSFTDARGYQEAFTQTQTNGFWATARPATFAADLEDSHPQAGFSSVSCSSPGDCTAAGNFKDAAGNFEAFTQASTNGAWANARPATYTAGMPTSGVNDDLDAVSCSAPGDCTAAGSFTISDNNPHALTQTETNGRWAPAKPATYATGVQDDTGAAALQSVSCSAPGDCTAGGYFTNAAGHQEAFTQTQTNGRWTTARPATYAAHVHGTAPSDGFLSVSCATFGHCTATGYFGVAGGGSEAMTEAITTTRLGNAITITSRKPKHATVHGHPYRPTARARHGGTVKITVARASRKVCKLNHGKVSYHKAGTCTLHFNDAAHAAYAAAPQRTQRFRVKAKHHQPRR